MLKELQAKQSTVSAAELQKEQDECLFSLYLFLLIILMLMLTLVVWKRNADMLVADAQLSDGEEDSAPPPAKKGWTTKSNVVLNENKEDLKLALGGPLGSNDKEHNGGLFNS
jgi:hypothetical protein